MADARRTPSFWNDRPVYLTGGTGFIGTELARSMTERGAEVTVLTRRRERAKHLEAMGCTVVEGDVTRPDTIDLGDANTVVHGAAWVAMGIPKKKRDLFWRTNVEGAAHVLEKAKEAGVNRYCHVSSVAAVGATPSGLYDESRAVEGRAPVFKSFYEKSKHAAHLHVLEHHGKLRTTLPMPGVVLGRGADTEALLRAYLKGRWWDVKDDNPTAFVHVRDTVEGIVLAIEKGEGPYILADQNLTIHQLLGLFEEASGRPAPRRAVSLRTLKLLARTVQAPYHALGKVPPLSMDVIRGLEVPLTYSAARASKELGWAPDLLGHLREDFATLQGEA